MATILVTYDLKTPGRNYQPIYDYLNKFTACRGLDSVWLLDTTVATATIRDELMRLGDKNDIFFVVRLSRDWAAAKFICGEWLNKPERNW
jgi:hypothetical protein